jgi:hypothetical protein
MILMLLFGGLLLVAGYLCIRILITLVQIVFGFIALLFGL